MAAADKSSQYQRYATDLWDGFDALCKHTANEIQFCKDTLKFFKKRIEIEETYAKSLNKLSQKSEYASTNHRTVKTAFESVLQETANTSNLHNTISTQLQEKVHDALIVLIKDMEASRKTLVNDGNALNNEYAKTTDALKKAKAEYQKACKEAEIAQLTFQKAKQDGQTKPKDLEKLEKEAQKKKQLSQSADEEYKARVASTNAFLEKYYGESMPRILAEFEHLDTVRIHLLKTNMKKYIQVASFAPPTIEKELQALRDSIDKINTDADLEFFVRQNKTGQEIPEPFEYEPYQEGNQAPKVPKMSRFGIKSVLIKSGKGAEGTTSTTSLPTTPREKPASAVFGVSIKQVMDKQKDKFPELEVPRVLIELVDAMFLMKGTQTEGIFRVPAVVSDVKMVKDRIDQGIYDITTATEDVQTPCALLKLWLRELPDPIIPEKFYETCTETPDKAMEVLAQLEPQERAIVTYMVHLMQELAQPQYVEHTKMDQDNLSMVFAPGFLRCPYLDYNKALTAAEKEKEFLNSLARNIPPLGKSIHDPAFVQSLHQRAGVPESPASSSSSYATPAASSSSFPASDSNANALRRVDSALGASASPSGSPNLVSPMQAASASPPPSPSPAAAAAAVSASPSLSSPPPPRRPPALSASRPLSGMSTPVKPEGKS